MNIASIGYQNNLNFGLSGSKAVKPVVEKGNNPEIVAKIEEILARAKKDPEFAARIAKALGDAAKGEEYGSHIVLFPRTPEQKGFDAVVKELK